MLTYKLSYRDNLQATVASKNCSVSLRWNDEVPPSSEGGGPGEHTLGVAPACDLGLPSESRHIEMPSPGRGESVELQAAVTMTEPANRHFLHLGGPPRQRLGHSGDGAARWDVRRMGQASDIGRRTIMSRTLPSTRRRRRCLRSNAQSVGHAGALRFEMRAHTILLTPTDRVF